MITFMLSATRLHPPLLVFCLLTVFGLLLTSTPGSAGKRRVQAHTLVLECPDGYEFVARIEGETAWLFLPGETLSLPHIPAASGAKYGDARTTFWSKGDEASLDSGEQQHRDCRNNRARAIWEHAKLSGVDFRATGNEPGWYLELSAGRKTVFVGDYGNTRYTFDTPPPLTGQTARITRYELQNDEHRLILLLEGRPCHDDMNGEAFETTVKLVLDGRVLQGCGRALH